MPHKTTKGGVSPRGIIKSDIRGLARGTKKRLNVVRQAKALRDLPGQRRRTQASQEQTARLRRQTRKTRPKRGKPSRRKLNRVAERVFFNIKGSKHKQT